MSELFDHIEDAKSFIQARWQGAPLVGIVLGTGLGGLAQDIKAEAEFPYSEIPHFPKSTAPSHKGQLVCGQLGGVKIAGTRHVYSWRSEWYRAVLIHGANEPIS